MAWEDNTQQNLVHLGITATHERKIKSGAEYEKYFEAAKGTTELINDDANVHDTLAFVGVLVNKTLGDTKKIAQVLKRTTLDATCKSIFDFFYQNYQYKLDEIGIEQVRRPSRAWADRKTGIDCDCFTTSVSSVLTNLGIEHHLKIIAINGKENFQHIYVVVPKRQGLDINSRANYWVIDPVLNHYDEEAPKITQTKHLKMNGIPLHQLNGIEESIAGLGNEFEGIEDELNGLDDESIGRTFHRRLKAHVSNTRAKIERDPRSVARFYKPHVLLAQMQKLESAMDGTEEHLMGVLEELSNTEHEAVQPQFRAVYDAMHGHDDHLYGVLYGDIDEKMLDGVLGLGRKGGARKGRAAKKAAKASKGKKGFFTKIKNAKKIIKSGKLKAKIKGAVKKIGRFIKKTNPLAIAARGGFIMAMRTNFAKIAEKAYWGYQTREFAKSKGITDEYYDACVKVKNRLLKVFVERLGGNEGTLKKPIMNGRAAKKIAKLLKKKGMSGTTEELFGLGSGLGVVTAAASATTITAAMAFLAPIIKMITGSFKGKKSGLEKNEKGGESEAATDDAATETEAMENEARRPSNTTIDDDGSIEAADAANDEEPSDESDFGSKKKIGDKLRTAFKKATKAVSTVTNQSSPRKIAAPTTTEADNSSEDTEATDADTTTSNKPSKGISGGIIAAAAVGVGLIAFAMLKPKSKATTNGLGNFSAKRESKNLKKKVAKAGLKLPHGYTVEKRKNIAVKTIKI